MLPARKLTPGVLGPPPTVQIQPPYRVRVIETDRKKKLTVMVVQSGVAPEPGCTWQPTAPPCPPTEAQSSTLFWTGLCTGGFGRGRGATYPSWAYTWYS